MRNLFNNRFLLFTALMSVAVVWLPSCDDKWSEHYDGAEENLPEENIYEYIEAHSSFSKFAEMLNSIGYDSIIGNSQTYTVWVPDNEALEGINANDSAMARQIVENHITRGSHSAARVAENKVKVFNGKNLVFSKQGDGYFFGDAPVKSPDILTSNGIIHVVEQYAPYKNNVWEHIGEADGLDSLRNFLYAQDTVVFDPQESTEIGFDTLGNPIYDSLFVDRNLYFEEYGKLDFEDTIFTMIMPDNQAWQEAYEEIKPYYNFPEVYGGNARQEKMTRWGIVRDLVFVENIQEPASWSRVRSTRGEYFYDPAQLFANSEQVDLSNGLGYETSTFNYVDTAAWYEEIRIEGEDPSGREGANNNIYVQSGRGTGFDVSDGEYIQVAPTGTNDFVRSSVTFSVPNTLSAKYNIYCVFVPESAVNPQDDRPTKVEYQLTYMSTTNGRTRRERITPEFNETNPMDTTKMFVTQFDFEFASVVDANYPEIPVRLQVTNTVRINEEADYSRQMRIDCIIFEPVVK